jgi:hypothetical protein
MSVKQEIYRSSTLGPIPLSFTGRLKLQNLRDAMQTLLTNVREAGGGYEHDWWKPVSEARGQLALYMSKLEQGKLTPECAGYEKHPHPYQRPQTVNNVHLPPIPEGYELKQVGSITSIAPVERVQVDTALRMNFAIDDAVEAKPKRYRVRYIGHEHENSREAPFSARFVGTGRTIVTFVELEGSIDIVADTAESAVERAAAEAHNMGHVVTVYDFAVQLKE